MASQFDEDFSAATPDFLELFGEWIQAKPLGQIQRPIRAIILRETRVSEGEMQAQNFFNTIEIQISSRDDIEGVVSPKEVRRGSDFDIFAIDGINWGLRRIIERNIGGMHKLLLWDGGATPA